MNYPSVKFCLISVFVALTARSSWCASATREMKSPEELAWPRVTCSSKRIRAVFGPMVRSNVRIRDTTGDTISVRHSEESCGVRLRREKDRSLSFSSTYDSCYALTRGSRVVVPLQIQLTGDDRWIWVNVTCPVIGRHNERTPLVPESFTGNCKIDRTLRVGCGHQSISRDDCSKLGCCYDPKDTTCYYRLNTCSKDGHFIFTVKATDTDPPIDPGDLIIRNQPQCFPVITTEDTAVFKIGVTDCDAKMMVKGDVMVYEVDVEELHTSSSPFSLRVHCEYEKSDLKQAVGLRSWYIPTNPPPVVAIGTIRVQMRIAKDASFTSFYPDDQLPLSLPLREAAYVEISIAQPSPDPTLSLRVRDCFAYPASRHSVWTLLYDGCPNPLDSMRSSVPVDSQGKTDSHSQVRRFDVKMFAFLDPDTGQPSVEEIYFYCWVEICPNDIDCAQRCAIISSVGERQKREAASESDQTQLVSLGPLRMGRNSTEVEDSPCARQTMMFQATVYILSGVGAALLLLLIFAAWSKIQKLQKPEEQQASDTQDDKE